MISGKLDRRIKIQRLERSRGPAGGAVDTLVTVATVWAQIVRNAGRESYAADAMQEVAFQRITFAIRYRTDILPDMSVEYHGKTFGIIAVTEIGRLEGLQLVTEWRQDLQSVA